VPPVSACQTQQLYATRKAGLNLPISKGKQHKKFSDTHPIEPTLLVRASSSLLFCLQSFPSLPATNQSEIKQ